MNPVIRGNFRMAWASIKSTKWRSGFTMFGVIVAVVPVLTILGIGEGVKRQIGEQVGSLGADLITIRPGNLASDDDPLKQFNSLSGYSTGGILTKKDVGAVSSVPTVDKVAPLSLVPGTVSVNDDTSAEGIVVASNQYLPDLLQVSVQHGDFFKDKEYGRYVAVVGRGAAETLFGEGVPLGRAFDFRDQTFVVRGVLERSDTTPLSFSRDLNNAVIIPTQIATELMAQDPPIYEMLATPKEGATAEATVKSINDAMLKSRGGEQDFSVVTQAENLRVANRILTLLTAMVTAVAGIALIVSGIGIMNIMLVSVTERMHEIGVRKAIGATKRQILGQFLAESVILSTTGGVIGVGIALVLQYVIRIGTEVEPVITWEAVLLVLGVSWLVGVIFGSIPAIKAAKKDPIDALRYE